MPTDEGRSCIFPIVPRAKDVGMLHDYGVSVTTHTKDGVQALTNPYVLAEDVIAERPIRYLRLTNFEGDSGLLFRQSTLLEGFPRGNEKTTIAAPQPTGMLASGSSSQENVHVHANAREAFLEESELPRVKAAEVAAAAGDWSSAAAIWNELRCDFPGQVRYWLKEAQACIDGGVLNAAESLLDEALALFPNDRWVAYQRVRLARVQGDWSKASKGAEALRRSAPDFWPGWVEAAHALAGLNRDREAEDLARQAVANFPGEFWPNSALARLEASKSTAPDAVRIWAALVDRFPGEPNAAAALATAKRAEGPPAGQGNSSGRAA